MKRVSSPEMQEFEQLHLTILRHLAPECMVLLKKNGDFPLPAPCAIALYGSGARQTVKGGTGSGDVNVRHYATAEEGLENAGFQITTKSWLDQFDRLKDEAKTRFYDEILVQAQEEGKPAFLLGLGRMPRVDDWNFEMTAPGDAAIYVLARNSGEGADRADIPGDLRLTESEIRDIRHCQQTYAKFMLVLNVGGPVDLSPVIDEVENVLLLSQLGSVTGDAFADVLLGHASPSGKLTTTWAAAEEYSHIGDFAEQDDTRYREGIFVGYRYFDAMQKKSIFPFGFGLSYTSFSTGMKGFTLQNGEISIQAEVSNTGSFAGKEVAALYYSAPDGKLKKPRWELGAYQKTRELRPGEREMLTLSLTMENMASWDEATGSWLLEKGDYVLRLNDQPVGIVVLEHDIVTATCCHVGGQPDFRDWLPSFERAVPDHLPRICFDGNLSGQFDRGSVSGEHLDSPDLSDWTEEELALACTGKFKENQGVAGIIGNAAFSVAGAAGETADVIQKKGFGKMVLADGPAGLRLTTSYVLEKEGALGLDAGSFQEVLRLFSEPVQQLIRAKTKEAKVKAKTESVFYQYASAIPIGTALAQAWNPAVPQACGDIVGEEMELFGVNVWLAPALNIHRSPLCGRNFEYYSEDPLLSGKTAAAMTRGVQAHRNCAVTIKHFCCNNQETNRFGSNSLVSERALREIYLKGFEICVKEAAPRALMTSYNLLNGTHTANRRDLLTDVLRHEWGFTGFVMTDWGTTGNGLNTGKHGASSPSLCILSGNDLIMSGNQGDVDGILAGLKEGTITRADLEACAARVIAMAKRLSNEALSS